MDLVTSDVSRGSIRQGAHSCLSTSSDIARVIRPEECIVFGPSSWPAKPPGRHSSGGLDPHDAPFLPWWTGKWTGQSGMVAVAKPETGLSEVKVGRRGVAQGILGGAIEGFIRRGKDCRGIRERAVARVG